MGVEREWTDLRSTRSNRPGEAGVNDRRGETYSAALEQAEQLFTAARGVTPASSPLLLFYGISQLGRALSAASPRLSENVYRLKGHGIKSPDTSWSNGQLDDVSVRANSSKDKPGAFQRVAQVVDACAFEDRPRQLGALIELVSLVDSDIEDSARLPKYPPLSVSPTPDGSEIPQLTIGPGPMTAFVGGVPRSLMPHESASSLDAPLESGPEWPGNTARERLTQFFDSYPTLRGWQLSTKESDSLTLRRYLPPRYDVMQILLQLPLDEGERSIPLPKRFTSEGVGEAMACPDGCGKPDHPLTLWWALLFSLSMLARYAPSEWRRIIDVDVSPDAVRVEQILMAARSTVPQLALAVLRSMNSPNA